MIYRKICTGISFVKGRPVLDIFCRDNNNNRHCVKIQGLPCYFYVTENTEFEEDVMKQSVLSIHSGYRSLFGNQLKKVTVRKISEVRKLGRQYNGFESDLKWDKKMLLDLKITDKFVYAGGKPYTLDDRFNVLNDVDIDTDTDDGFSSSARITDVDGKVVVKKALKLDRELSSTKPLLGNTPFEPRVVVVDIETIVDRREQLRTFEGQIACVVMYDSYTKEYFTFKLEGSEKMMITKVLEKFKELDADIITGWNVDFDLKWIINKAEFFDLDLNDYFPGGKTWIQQYTDPTGTFHETINIGGRVVLDAMELYKKKTITTEKLSSYSLKFVAMVEGFPEWEDLGARIKELWSSHSKRVVEYCKLDVERTLQVIEKKRLIDGALTTCKFFGCGFDDVTVNSKVIECMMFLLKRNRILPNIQRGRDKPNIIGAVVLDTIPGLHTDVGIFDAASLYPSIIAGFNISPECLVPAKDLFEDRTKDIITVPIGEYRHHLLKREIKTGLMTEVITEMRKLREDIRAKRQEATKVGNNELFELYNDEEKVAKGVLASVYGVMGFKEFRLFNEDCANVITAVARGMIETIKKKIEGDEWHIIYGDTDSLFIKTYGVESGFRAQKKINEIMPEYLQTFGVTDNVISVNFEKFFKWILFLKKVAPKRKTKLWKRDMGSAKKAYIGYISYKESGAGEMKPTSELYYRGIALRRSDSAPCLKDTMREFFKLMENGDYHRPVDYLKDVYDQFHTFDANYIAMPRSVEVPDANNPWANGMRYAKESLGFEFDDNQMPKLLYVKNQHKYPKTDVICYQDGHKIPPEFEIDYETMFNKLIRMKFEPILESLGLFWDTHIGKQGSLDQWIINAN